MEPTPHTPRQRMLALRRALISTSWPPVVLAFAVGVVLLVLEAAATLLDGLPYTLTDRWRQHLLLPLLSIYLILALIITERLFVRTLRTFRRVLLLQGERDFADLVDELQPARPRDRWLVIGLSAFVMLLIHQPWQVERPWLRAYVIFGEALIGALAGALLALALTRTLLFNRLRQQPIDLRALRELRVTPRALWGLSMLALLGGLVLLTLVLRTGAGYMVLDTSVMYGGIVILIVLVLFFVRLLSSLFESVYRSRLLYSLALVVVTAIVGAVGYHFIEGWPYMDALYMTVITMTTVGYGEILPLSDAGRVFTMVLAVVSIGIGGYCISTIAAFLIEGEVNRFLRGRRMDRAIASMKGHIILCGGGRIGRHVASEFYKARTPFVLLDYSAETLEEVAEMGPFLCLQGDVTDDKVLRLAGIDRAQGLVAALGDDRDNVFLVLSARSINPHIRIIARLNEDENAEKLRRAGADDVVSPNVIGGRRMATMILRPSVISFIDEMIRATGNRLVMHELEVEHLPGLHGKSLRDAGIGGPHIGLLVIAIKTIEGEYRFNPRGQTILQKGDTLVMMGTPEQFAALERLQYTASNASA